MTPLPPGIDPDDVPPIGELEEDLENMKRAERLERERNLERKAPHGPGAQDLERTNGSPGPAPELVEDLDTIGDPRLRKLLELNGFNAIQSEALGVVNAIAGLPVEALDAAILYHDAAIARLRMHPDPRARSTIPAAERHGRYLTYVRKARRDLGELNARLEATESLIAP